MRHVIAARVLRDTHPHPLGRTNGGGGDPSTPGSDSFSWRWDVGGGGEELEDLDLLAGMPSNDTDYRKVSEHLNYTTITIPVKNDADDRSIGSGPTNSRLP